MFDPIDSANEAAAQRQIDYDMRHAGVHPIFAGILGSMCPPPDDGQQQAQAESEQPWIPPIERLEQGGYRYEARLLRETLDFLETVAFGNTEADRLAELALPLIAKLEGKA